MLHEINPFRHLAGQSDDIAIPHGGEPELHHAALRGPVDFSGPTFMEIVLGEREAVERLFKIREPLFYFF